MKPDHHIQRRRMAQKSRDEVHVSAGAGGQSKKKQNEKKKGNRTAEEGLEVDEVLVQHRHRQLLMGINVRNIRKKDRHDAM